MTQNNETPEGGPCPPLKDVTEDEQPDTVLSNETEADYDAEEKDEADA